MCLLRVSSDCFILSALTLCKINRYPSGGLDNTKESLLDEIPQLTGAGTGDEYHSVKDSWQASRCDGVSFSLAAPAR